MNTQAHGNPPVDVEVFGRAIAARLTESMDDLPHDITERLRAARSQAVAKRRLVSAQPASEISISGGEATLQFGDDEGWLNRIASLLPLLALIVGLLSIGILQDEMRAKEVAEVDAELLTDVLPPAAYTDPGFAQFIRTNHPH
jgi:Protein of unknown function (DUF3619)